MGGASKNRKIRDRVDSEGKYGRWKLQIIGSCYKSSRPRVGSPTNHFVYRFASFKSLLDNRLVRLQVISSTSHTSSLIRVGSPKSHLSFTSVSPTSRFAYGSIRPLVLSPTHAWKLLPKTGPSKCPAFPSPLVQNMARPFSSRAKSKNSPGFPPPLWGEWYEYTISSREIPNLRGKSFLLIPCLPYSVQFSKNTAVVKKHFDTIYKFRNFWF